MNTLSRATSRTRRVTRLEVAAGLVALSLPFQLLAVTVWNSLHVPAPCGDGEALSQEVRADGFVQERDWTRPSGWEEDAGCVEDWRRDGWDAERQRWVNPQGNVGLKCEEAFGLRPVRVIPGHEKAYGLPIDPDAARQAPHEGCQVVGFDLPEHWEVAPG